LGSLLGCQSSEETEPDEFGRLRTDSRQACQGLVEKHDLLIFVRRDGFGFEQFYT
jgi:hypothetical protein